MRVVFFILSVIFSVTSFAGSVLNIKSWQSNSGAKVFFVKSTQLPMLDINIIFKAGSAYDGSYFGVSSFVNNMLGEGTSSLSADEVADQFDKVGAEFSASSGLDSASVHLRSLTNPHYLKPALATFASVIAHPSFPEKGISRVRGQTLAGIKYQQQLPDMIARNKFYKRLYKDKPYAHPAYGSEGSVSEIKKQDLINFYKKYYVAKNSKIILVGDITLKKAHFIAEKISKEFQAGKEARKLSSNNFLDKAENSHVNFPSAQTSIMLGQVGINSQDPLYTPLVVGSYILGGMPLSSILFKQVRDKRGLAYFATSRFIPDSARGPFLIQLNTRALKTREAIDVVKKVLRDYISYGPTEAQLIAAKKNLIGGFPMLFDSNSKILSLVSNLVIYNRPLNYFDSYIKRINALTTAQIQKAFAKTLHPNKLLTVTVGPKTNG